MAELGIMIEGQEDMTWARFFRIAEAVEDLGFAHLFRSDHLTGIFGHPERATLALWPSLTALAMRTKRLRFGPMVCAITFRHPIMVAKMAAAVDQLSGGRFHRRQPPTGHRAAQGVRGRRSSPLYAPAQRSG